MRRTDAAIKQREIFFILLLAFLKKSRETRNYTDVIFGLVVFLFHFKIALRMRADRADFRSFLADDDVAAV